MSAPEHFAIRVLEAAMNTVTNPSEHETWLTEVLKEMRIGSLFATIREPLFRMVGDREICLLCGWELPPGSPTGLGLRTNHKTLHRNQVKYVLGITTEEPSWEYTDEYSPD